MNYLPTFGMVLVVAASVGQGVSTGQEGVSWKERFLTEAPSAWEKYRTRTKRLQGSLERTTVRLPPKKEVMERDRCEIKQTDGCALFLIQTLEGNNPPEKIGMVLATNGKYGFELRQEDPTARWAVTNLDTDLSDGMRFGFGSPPGEGVVLWFTCPTTLGLIPYFPVVGVEGPGFTVKEVTAIAQKDEQLAKVEFDYRPPRDKPRVPSVKGWVVYDPQRSWVIRELYGQVEWGWSEPKESRVVASVVMSYEYTQTVDEFPIPKRVLRRITPVGGVDRESRYDFDLKEADVPESDFTLSAFGFSEPGTPRLATRSRYLWIALLGLLGLSLAALLWVWKRRGSGSGEPTAQRG